MFSTRVLTTTRTSTGNPVGQAPTLEIQGGHQLASRDSSDPDLLAPKRELLGHTYSRPNPQRFKQLDTCPAGEYSIDNHSIVLRLLKSVEANKSMSGSAIRTELVAEVRSLSRLVAHFKHLLSRVEEDAQYTATPAQCSCCGDLVKGRTVIRASEFARILKAQLGLRTAVLDVCNCNHAGPCVMKAAQDRQDQKVVGLSLRLLKLSGLQERKELVGVWATGLGALGALGLDKNGGRTAEVVTSPSVRVPAVALHHLMLVSACSDVSATGRQIQSSLAAYIQCATLAGLGLPSIGRAQDIYNSILADRHLLRFEDVNQMLGDINRPTLDTTSTEGILGIGCKTLRRGCWRFVWWDWDKQSWAKVKLPPRVPTKDKVKWLASRVASKPWSFVDCWHVLFDPKQGIGANVQLDRLPK